MPCIRPLFRYAQWPWLAGLWLFCNTAAADIGLDAQRRVWQWQGRDLPQLMTQMPNATKVLQQNDRFFVLDNNGQLWAWGTNDAGQLGLGNFKPITDPQKVLIPARIKDVAAGEYHTIAVDESGQIWVWGANNRGQLGTEPASALTVVNRPVLLTIRFQAAQVAADTTQSLAKDTQGTIWAWGNTQAGQPSAPAANSKARWPEAPAARVRLLKGQVITAAGKGIPSADVVVNGKTCARSAANGQYTCALPARLSGTLSARAEGFKFKSSIKLPASADLDQADFVAEAPATPLAAPPVAKPSPAPSSPAVPISATAVVAPQPRKSLISLSGTVRTGNSAGSGLAGVQVQGKGANCAPTDDTGRFSCQVPAGWSGSLTVTKPGYRFAPSSVSLSAAHDDDPQVQSFRAYYEPR